MKAWNKKFRQESWKTRPCYPSQCWRTPLHNRNPSWRPWWSLSLSSNYIIWCRWRTTLRWKRKSLFSTRPPLSARTVSFALQSVASALGLRSSSHLTQRRSLRRKKESSQSRLGMPKRTWMLTQSRIDRTSRRRISEPESSPLNTAPAISLTAWSATLLGRGAKPMHSKDCAVNRCKGLSTKVRKV